MQFLPRCCRHPMTELKIQRDQVAALQSREEIQDTTFFAMFFRKDVDQTIAGGGWKVQGTPQVHKVSESGRSEVARVDLNGVLAQRSNHGFGHLTTGEPKTTPQVRHLHGDRLPCLRVFCFEGRHKGRKINRTIFFAYERPEWIAFFDVVSDICLVLIMFLLFVSGDPGLQAQCGQGRLLRVATIKTQDSQPYEAASRDEQPSKQILHRKLLQADDSYRNENGKHWLHCLRRVVTFDWYWPYWPNKFEANFKHVAAWHVPPWHLQASRLCTACAIALAAVQRQVRGRRGA